jgi:hypothetical protein
MTRTTTIDTEQLRRLLGALPSRVMTSQRRIADEVHRRFGDLLGAPSKRAVAKAVRRELRSVDPVTGVPRWFVFGSGGCLGTPGGTP